MVLLPRRRPGDYHIIAEKFPLWGKPHAIGSIGPIESRLGGVRTPSSHCGFWRPGTVPAVMAAMAPINSRHPPPTRRRALELLSDAGTEGCSEAVMLAHGFTAEQLVDLVRIGVATATPQPIVTGRGRYEIPMLRITEAGREALAQ
jgi:hypothetical protein